MTRQKTFTIQVVAALPGPASVIIGPREKTGFSSYGDLDGVAYGITLSLAPPDINGHSTAQQRGPFQWADTTAVTMVAGHYSADSKLFVFSQWKYGGGSLSYALPGNSRTLNYVVNLSGDPAFLDICPVYQFRTLNVAAGGINIGLAFVPLVGHWANGDGGWNIVWAPYDGVDGYTLTGGSVYFKAGGTGSYDVAEVIGTYDDKATPGLTAIVTDSSPASTP